MGLSLKIPSLTYKVWNKVILAVSSDIPAKTFYHGFVLRSFPYMERKFGEFIESDKSLKLNWSQFKDPVSHMCLAGTVVTS